MKAEREDLLIKVRLEDSLMECYPYELSSGQMQRVCIASGIVSRTMLIDF